jgi:hypothetical protein
VINRDRWTHICASYEDIPEQRRALLRANVANNLGQSVATMFPDFAVAFPRTVQAMAQHWPVPLVIMKTVVTDWIVWLVLERPDKNVFFDINGFASKHRLDDAFYDEYLRVLPPGWAENYRQFESFSITSKPYFGPPTNGSLFGYSGRLDTADFQEAGHATAGELNSFVRSLNVDANWFRCWYLNSARDSLWIDQQRRDQRVYHVNRGDFADVAVLERPAIALDMAQAHVLAGGTPEAFDFRAMR